MLASELSIIELPMGQTYTGSTPPEAVNWQTLVDGIRANDASALEELYALFGRGVRFYLYRQLGGQDVEDRLHDIFLIVVQAIQRGELREPERLMGFVRTIARRRVIAQIEEAVQDRKTATPIDANIPLRDTAPTPEDRALDRQQLDLMASALRNIPKRDREILSRFYLQEQTPEQICNEMHLTPTQFRLLKSRAKARFTEKGRLLSANFFARAFSGFRH